MKFTLKVEIEGMKRLFLTALSLILFILPRASFALSETKTCILIQDLFTRQVIFRKDDGICEERFTPDSSFKFPLALMAFDSGVLTPDTLMKWDGKKQPVQSWEQDTNARIWLKESVVWFSQKLTPLLGLKKIQNYLNSFMYGNQDFSGGLTEAWLDSTLKISPTEQMNFWRRVRWNIFNLKPKTLEQVFSLLPVEVNQAGLKVYGKTGSSRSIEDPNGKENFRLGWYIAYIEKKSKLYSITTLLKTPAEKGEFVYSGKEAKKIALNQIKTFSFPKAPKFNLKAWQEDYQQLKGMISQYYPNLETKLDLDHLNLKALDETTTAELKKTKTDVDALAVVHHFLGAFHDGHLNVVWQNLSRASAQASEKKEIHLTKDTPASEACQMFPVSLDPNPHFQFPTSTELGFSPVKKANPFFDSTVLNLKDKKIGFLRIPSFQSQSYPDFCPEEWEKYRSRIKSECDHECQEHFKDYSLPNRLLAELKTTVEGLQKEKISALVLDLSENGGGNDWVEAVARMLTDQPILCGQHAFIRGAHWTKIMREKIKDHEKELAETKDSKQKEKLTESITRAQKSLSEAEKTCDRSQMWLEPSYHPSCSLLVSEGINDCAPDSKFEYQPGLYKGPLFILADQNSASATEQLIARYQDSSVGTLIGEKTYGAGCGHTEGGLDLTLKNSGIKISIPDCARFLRNGENEVQGFKPKVPLDMGSMNTPAFVEKLKDYLTNALK